MDKGKERKRTLNSVKKGVRTQASLSVILWKRGKSVKKTLKSVVKKGMHTQASLCVILWKRGKERKEGVKKGHCAQKRLSPLPLLRRVDRSTHHKLFRGGCTHCKRTTMSSATCLAAFRLPGRSPKPAPSTSNRNYRKKKRIYFREAKT